MKTYGVLQCWVFESVLLFMLYIDNMTNDTKYNTDVLNILKK